MQQLAHILFGRAAQTAARKWHRANPRRHDAFPVPNPLSGVPGRCDTGYWDF